MKTVYNYDLTSKVYIGEGVAFPSPLEKDVYHYPANSTLKAPPTYDAATQQAVWNGERWNILAQSEQATDSAGQPTVTWQQYQTRALNTLVQSNEVMAYIVDAVVLGATTFSSPDVVDFVKWRKQLKDILGIQNGDATVPLPARPKLPTGVLGAASVQILPKKG
jgi:hypothetical protein